MKIKPATLLIHTTPEGHNIVVMDLADEREAVEVAMDLARQTGRTVPVRDENLGLIETIPAAVIQ